MSPILKPAPAAGSIPLCATLLLFVGCDLADAAAEADGSIVSTDSTGKTKAKKKKELPLVRTEPLVVRDVLRQIKDVGHAESLHIVEVLSKVSERVEEVLVDEGDEIERGQVLARLDSKIADLKVRELEIQVREAIQAIDEKQLAYDEAIQKNETAKVDEAKKQRDYEQKVKIAKDIMSPLELDDALTAHQKAKSDLKVSELAAKRAKVMLASARNAVERTKVLQEQAKLDLTERTIRSPLTGVVSVRHVAGGESVSAGSGPLFTVIDHRNLVCVQSRTQQDLPFLRKGQEVFITTDAYPGEEFKGEVDVISPVIEKDTGSFRLRIRIKDDANKIHPGMFLRSRIVTGQSIKALTCTKRAVLYEGDRPLAWVIRDGRSHRIYIEPGIEEREFIEVTNRGDRGFRPGDTVVVSGHKNLRDGREVELVQK